MRRLGLIGFSGSGKSSLAYLAAKSGFAAVDSDTLIKAENPNAANLLENGREEDFRTLETSVISVILKSDFDFAAFGGGIHFAHPAWKEIYDSGLKLVYLEIILTTIFVLIVITFLKLPLLPVLNAGKVLHLE